MASGSFSDAFAALRAAAAAENPYLDPDREARVRLMEERVRNGLAPFTGQPPPAEKSLDDLLKEAGSAERLSDLPCFDDLEAEFDDEVEAATTKALMRCEHYSVDALDFSVRTRRCLHDMRIRTIGDLGAYTQGELRDLVGELSVSEVLDRLRERGIVLKPK